MRILKAQVNNYKSLKSVEVEFGKSTILIGRNSSGKSNFLEALFLFFNQFDPAPQRDIGGVPDYLWHNRETENPIELILAVRDNPSQIPQLTERPPNILPETQRQIVATLDSDTLAEARIWQKIEKDIEEIPSLTRLHVRAGQLRNREGLIRFPISYLGGGDQEICYRRTRDSFTSTLGKKIL